MINDLFGPAGNIRLLQNYSLHIYNRFGQLIFHSSNPAQKWNGNNKSGLALSGTYVYVATYMYNGVKKITKGTLVLLL
jgi:gliding motility-associated-like protein